MRYQWKPNGSPVEISIKTMEIHWNSSWNLIDISWSTNGNPLEISMKYNVRFQWNTNGN